MAILSVIQRLRRGDFSPLLLASLLVLLSMPAALDGNNFVPHGAQAVLFWLQGESVAAQSAQLEAAVPPAPLRALARLATLQTEPRLFLTKQPLENHEASLLSGVRSNRRLN